MTDASQGVSALPGQRPLTSAPTTQATPSCVEVSLLASPKSSEAISPKADGRERTDESTASPLASNRDSGNLQEVWKQVDIRQEHLELRLKTAIAELLEQQFSRLLREFSEKLKGHSSQDARRAARQSMKHKAPAGLSGHYSSGHVTRSRMSTDRRSLPSSSHSSPRGAPSPGGESRKQTDESLASLPPAENSEEQLRHFKLMAATPIQLPALPPPSQLLPALSDSGAPFAQPPELTLPRTVDHILKKNPSQSWPSLRTSPRGSRRFSPRNCLRGPQKPCPPPRMHNLPEKDGECLGEEDLQVEMSDPVQGISSMQVSTDSTPQGMSRKKGGSMEPLRFSGHISEMRISSASVKSSKSTPVFFRKTDGTLAQQDSKALDEWRSLKRGQAMTFAADRADRVKTKNTKKTMFSRRDGEEDFLERLLNNPFFDTTCALIIVINSVLIGVTTEYLTDHDEETLVHSIMGQLCSLFFLVELVMRLRVHSLDYFTCQDRYWNWFDFTLVMFSIIDFGLLVLPIQSEGAGSIGSTLKIVKMLRIVRIFRVFRFFKELSLLALMIMDSLRSLVWALLMLAIIIYVFAICFTQSATEFMKDLDTDRSTWSADQNNVQKEFGSLGRTIYALVRSMLDGVSWGVVSDTLIYMDVFSAFLFFCYISFTVLAVLNIITGVFVDNAVETAKTEREFLIQKEMEIRERLTVEMHDLFQEMDEDGSGSISLEELQAFFNDQRVQGYFQALGLEGSDTERLFRLLDTDGKGEVFIDEFLEGCIRLKGEARSIDVHSVMFECRKIMSRLDEWDEILDGAGGFGASLASAQQSSEAEDTPLNGLNKSESGRISSAY